MRRCPDRIAQVGRRVELDLAQLCERQPEIAPVHHRLQHRAQAHVGIGNPVEPRAVDVARSRRRRLERPRPQLRRCGRICALQLLRLDQPGQPFLRLAKDQRGLRTREHLFAVNLADDRLAVGLRHLQGPGVQFATHFQLPDRPGPVAQDTQQLEQENPQLGIARLGPDKGL